MVNGVGFMNSSRRSTRLWLGLLGVAVSLLVVGALVGSVAPALAVTMGVLYIITAIVALGGVRPTLWRRSLQETTAAMTVTSKTTQAARKAAQRARNRGEFSIETALLDIGLMINERRRTGELDRRLAESVSTDVNAVQPFVKVHINPGAGERLALVEFEMYDQAGNVQFSHQQKFWVRDGENLIACEQQLPMRGNPALGRAGTWDLRVKVDGTLTGMHGFSVMAAQPSAPPPGRRLAQQDSDEYAGSDSPDEQDAPISLEDLLREQRRRSDGQ
jgi:hypothetical protein